MDTLYYTQQTTEINEQSILGVTVAEDKVRQILTAVVQSPGVISA